jgi:hypothetical protein
MPISFGNRRLADTVPIVGKDILPDDCSENAAKFTG